MSSDLGKPVHFKGPGQWHTQADRAQRRTRPPAAVLDPAPARRSEDLGEPDPDELDDADPDALLADAEDAEAEVSRFNPFHAPAGSPAGGQFTAGPAGKSGGQASGDRQHRVAEAAKLRNRAMALRAQADKLAARLKALVARLKATAAAHRKVKAAEGRARQQAAHHAALHQQHQAAVKAAGKGAKAAAYNAAHPGAQAAHRKAAAQAAHHRTHRRHHARTALNLHEQITSLRHRIRELRAQAAELDAQAAKLVHRFDPHQPRGEHTGEWVKGAGGAAEIAGAKGFLDQHYSAWRQDLSPAQDRGMRFYQSPGFALMNGLLRGRDPEELKRGEHASDGDLDRARKATKDLTAAIRKAPPLPQDVTSYRGMDPGQFGRLTPGQVVSDPAFVSVSLTK